MTGRGEQTMDEGSKASRNPFEALGSIVEAARNMSKPARDLDGAPPFTIPEGGKVNAWRSVMGGRQARIAFPNGYEASIVCHAGSYGGNEGLWELAVCDAKTEEIVYDTPITDDVIGRMTEAEVSETLARIAALSGRNESRSPEAK